MAWVSGMLFGMGLERRLLERKSRKIQTKKRNDCAPHPLPIPNVEAPGNPEKFGKPGLLVIAKGKDDEGTIGVVLGRRDVLPSVPVGEALRDARSGHIEPPNRDRRKPHDLPLPHHRAYGTVHGGSMNKFLSSCKEWQTHTAEDPCWQSQR